MKTLTKTEPSSTNHEENPRFIAAIDGITDGFNSPDGLKGGSHYEIPDLDFLYKMGVNLGQTVVNLGRVSPIEENPFKVELEPRQYTSSELRTLRTRQQAQHDVLRALYTECLSPKDEIINIVKAALDAIEDFGAALDEQYKTAAKYGKKK
jgi:hypothetical protein